MVLFMNYPRSLFAIFCRRGPGSLLVKGPLSFRFRVTLCAWSPFQPVPNLAKCELWENLTVLTEFLGLGPWCSPT